MLKKSAYYITSSYRRKKLDKLLEENKKYYHGYVLDIGERDRGKFIKPKDAVQKWVFADIDQNGQYKPDIILDVTKMINVQTESVDVINATELFEHVQKIEAGLQECHRILKKNGLMIISIPFLYPIHADPFDFQRWTDQKWKNQLEQLNFTIEKFIITGRFFTVLGDNLKFLIKSFWLPIRLLCYLLLPLLGLLVSLDNLNLIKNNKILNKFHGGYFIILKK